MTLRLVNDEIRKAAAARDKRDNAPFEAFGQPDAGV